MCECLPTELEDQKRYIMEKVEGGMIFLDNRNVVGFWMSALQALVDEDKIEMCLREIDEQYSRLEITKVQVKT